jgi:hypothetical protein
MLHSLQYCDIQVVNEVVLPLLAMQSTVLLCISTLLESSNHYSKMFELKDKNGKPLFETQQISLVCEECMKTDTPEKCTHRLNEMPRWLSSQKIEVIKALLADDPALLLRESMGVSAETTQRAFNEPQLVRFIERSPIRITLCNYIYVAVDPAGGGNSAFAIATIGVMYDGTIAVRLIIL